MAGGAVTVITEGHDEGVLRLIAQFEKQLARYEKQLQQVSRGSKKQSSEAIKIAREQARVEASVLTPMEKHQKLVDRMKVLVQKYGMSQTIANRAIEKSRMEMIRAESAARRQARAQHEANLRIIQNARATQQAATAGRNASMVLLQSLTL